MKVKQVRIVGDTALEYQDGELVGLRRLPARGEQSEPPEDLDTLKVLDIKVLDIVAYNQAAERMFVTLLEQMLRAQAVNVRDLVAEAAYRLGVSLKTAKRYLTKYTAPSAPYAVRGGQIVRKGGER